MTTADENKRVMARFVEFVNTASEQLAAELISPKCEFHIPMPPHVVSGPPGYMLVLGMMRGGFSDVQWALEELVTEGDTVACRFTMRGTHDGTFFGVAPTGKHVEMQAMNFYRIVDKQIVAERGQPDLFGLLKQIGGIPG